MLIHNDPEIEELRQQKAVKNKALDLDWIAPKNPPSIEQDDHCKIIRKYLSFINKTKDELSIKSDRFSEDEDGISISSDDLDYHIDWIPRADYDRVTFRFNYKDCTLIIRAFDRTPYPGVLEGYQSNLSRMKEVFCKKYIPSISSTKRILKKVELVALEHMSKLEAVRQKKLAESAERKRLIGLINEVLS